jgi:putative transposase
LTVLGYPRSSWYRHQQPGGGRVDDPIGQADRVQPQALDAAEVAQIIAWLSEERFADLSVQQVFYRVFDEGHYVASQRTWYRVAAQEQLSGDRRRQSKHPPKTIPELVAHGPNQVWSWDISRIKIAVQKTPLHLYLIEDVFSRKCVGWRLEHREKDELARDLIADAVTAEGTTPHTLHADGGASMTSDIVAELLAGLGITRSRSRPHVSNDNPFSESLFKTIKYDLSYPVVFDDFDHAQTWIEAFIHRYHTEHRHSGLHGYTPASVHDGTWTATAARRQALLTEHHQNRPGRYRTPPQVPTPPGTVWINKPKEPDLSQAA